MIVIGPAFEFRPAHGFELRVRKPEWFRQKLCGELDAIALGHRDGIEVFENFRRRYHAGRGRRGAFFLRRLRLHVANAGKQQGHQTQDSHDAASPHYMRYKSTLAA